MANKTQPVTVETEEGVATEATRRIGKDEGSELVLQSGCQDWNVAQYNAGDRTFLDARPFSAKLSDWTLKEFFDRCGSRRETDTGKWERCWVSWSFNDLGILTQVVRSIYRSPVTSIDWSTCEICGCWWPMWLIFWRRSDFELECFKPPYDRLFLVHDDSDRWRELDFKGCHRRVLQQLGLSGWYSFKIFELPHRDLDGLYPSVPTYWRLYQSQKSVVVAGLIV